MHDELFCFKGVVNEVFVENNVLKCPKCLNPMLTVSEGNPNTYTCYHCGLTYSTPQKYDNPPINYLEYITENIGGST